MQRLVGNKILEGGGNKKHEGGLPRITNAPTHLGNTLTTMVTTPRPTRPKLAINKPEMRNKSEGSKAGPAKLCPRCRPVIAAATPAAIRG